MIEYHSDEIHSHFRTIAGTTVYELIPLADLQPGQIAEIGRLEGRPEHIKRLEELGLRTGKPVEVLRCGRTCIIKVGCHRLCLRQDDRMRVYVASAAHRSAGQGESKATHNRGQGVPAACHP